MSVRILGLSVVLLLAACTRQAPVDPQAEIPVSAEQSDPLRCTTRADCTTKVSRTLLFVFDYAAVGGHLVQRQERLLFTPPEMAPSDWPAIRILLAEPVDSRFEFSAECRVAGCRYGADELLRVYRSYLADQPCSLLLDSAVQTCSQPFHRPLVEN